MLVKFKKAASKHIDTIIDSDFRDHILKQKYDLAKYISRGKFLKYVSDKSKIEKNSEFKQTDGYLFLINNGNGFKRDLIEVYYDRTADHILDIPNPKYSSITTFKFFCTDIQFKKISDIVELMRQNPNNFENIKIQLDKATKGIKFEVIK